MQRYPYNLTQPNRSEMNNMIRELHFHGTPLYRARETPTRLKRKADLIDDLLPFRLHRPQLIVRIPVPYVIHSEFFTQVIPMGDPTAMIGSRPQHILQRTPEPPLSNVLRDSAFHSAVEVTTEHHWQVPQVLSLDGEGVQAPTTRAMG